MKQEIKDLKNKIDQWKGLSRFKDYSKEIAEAEARIKELELEKSVKEVVVKMEEKIEAPIVVKKSVAKEEVEEADIEEEVEEYEEHGKYEYESWWNVVMPTEEFLMKDKKMDYKTLAIVNLNSKYKGETICDKKGLDYSEIEQHRYLYKSSIRENKEELEKMSNWKLRTIQRNINKLAEGGSGIIEVCKDSKGKVFYKIYPSISEEGHNRLGKYVKIDSRILKYLAIYDSVAIKVYCTLVWKLAEGEQQITYEWLAEKVGLKFSEHSQGNLTTIADIIDTFVKVGLINRKNYNYIKEDIDGDVLIRSYKYSLNSYEEFRRILKEPRR